MGIVLGLDISIDRPTATGLAEETLTETTAATEASAVVLKTVEITDQDAAECLPLDMYDEELGLTAARDVTQAPERIGADHESKISGAAVPLRSPGMPQDLDGPL